MPDNTTTSSAAEPAPAKKRGLFGCLLSILVGALAFVIALIAIAIWVLGTRVPLDAASKIVRQKSGGELTFGENDTNLFAGRVHWKNVTLTNPSRFRYRNFLTLNEVKAEVKPFSATGDVIQIPEVILDIGEVSLVAAGKVDLAGLISGGNFLKDNNVMDFKKAFAPESAQGTAESKPEDSQTPAQPVRFHIGKLTLKFGSFRVVSDGATPDATPAEVLSKAVGLNLTFNDVTESNWTTSVLPVLKAELEKAAGFSLGGLLDMGKQAVDKFVNDAKAQAQKALEAAQAQAEKVLNDAKAKAEAEAAKLAEKASEAVNKATSQANDAVNKAKEDVAKKAGSLLNFGKKKEAPKPEEPAK